MTRVTKKLNFKLKLIYEFKFSLLCSKQHIKDRTLGLTLTGNSPHRSPLTFLHPRFSPLQNSFNKIISNILWIYRFLILPTTTPTPSSERKNKWKSIETSYWDQEPIKQLCTRPTLSQKSVLKWISKEVPFPKVQLGNASLTHWNLCYLLWLLLEIFVNIFVGDRTGSLFLRMWKFCRGSWFLVFKKLFWKLELNTCS